jgi:hypothetical protein
VKTISSQIIQEFLEQLGSRYPKQATLHLLGGSALILLGSSRDTLDIDYVGDDIRKDDFQQFMEKVADEMELDVEAVPIEHFIPLPNGNEQRSIHIGKFGNVDVLIVDPYTIALSKLDRGKDTDLDDIVFLVHRAQINLKELERILNDALPHATKFDFHPEIREHLQELKKLLK